MMDGKATYLGNRVQPLVLAAGQGLCHASINKLMYCLRDIRHLTVVQSALSKPGACALKQPQEQRLRRGWQRLHARHSVSA